MDGLDHDLPRAVVDCACPNAHLEAMDSDLCVVVACMAFCVRLCSDGRPSESFVLYLRFALRALIQTRIGDGNRVSGRSICDD